MDSVVVVGEIGGDAEEELCKYIEKSSFKKPVVGYIAGRSAPKETKMGTLVQLYMVVMGLLNLKVSAFAQVDIPVAKKPTEIQNC